MSAQEVADTKRLGYPISHDQIANYESGRKRGLDITELLVLAAALEVSPIALLFPATSDREVEMLLRAATSTLHAVAWSSGGVGTAWLGEVATELAEQLKRIDRAIHYRSAAFGSEGTFGATNRCGQECLSVKGRHLAHRTDEDDG